MKKLKFEMYLDEHTNRDDDWMEHYYVFTHIQRGEKYYSFLDPQKISYFTTVQSKFKDVKVTNASCMIYRSTIIYDGVYLHLTSINKDDVSKLFDLIEREIKI